MKEKNINDSIKTLKGVGEKRAEVLNSLGINSINDLLTYYPKKINNFSISNLDEESDSKNVTVKGYVSAKPIITFYGFRKSKLEFNTQVNNENIKIIFYNQPWLKNIIFEDQILNFYGKYNHLKRTIFASKIIDNKTQISPEYFLKKGITEKNMKQYITDAYSLFSDEIENILPEDIMKENNLLDRKKMIHDMHFPKNFDEYEIATRSAKFEEIFLFQSRIKLMSPKNTDDGNVISFNQSDLDYFSTKLPFKLTDSQLKVISEIAGDLSSKKKMNRLLQGDVGSGKTVASMFAAYLVVKSGRQVAFMAPTEVLAQQQLNNFINLFSNFDENISISLLTSSVKNKQKTIDDVNDGKIDIVIGTHALIQEKVLFNDLGLAIIDEQHRFGVNQRNKLKKIDDKVEFLSMTATPIPRTLTLTVYGDMDVSSLKEKPIGRKEIITKFVPFEKANSVLAWSKKEILKKNSQVYIVTPLVQESENVQLSNATDIFNNVRDILAPDISVGLIHGGLKNEEKKEIMSDFKKNKINVLVSTSVIEVGIDVANANIIIILDANRFGLSQLHQLRGRVGRSDNQSYAIMIADPKNDDAKKRLEIISESNDGFYLAEKDLEIRGPGDLLGIKQSGLPQFKLNDPIKDFKYIKEVDEKVVKFFNKNKNKNNVFMKYLLDTSKEFKNLD